MNLNLTAVALAVLGKGSPDFILQERRKPKERPKNGARKDR